MLYNKRKYLYTLIYFFYVLNSKRYECIFEIKFILFLFIEFKFFKMIDNLISDLVKKIWINF